MLTRLILALVLMVLPATPAAVAQPHNTLSRAERADNWRLLFDGQTTEGWTTAGDINAWGVVDGELVVVRPGRGWWLRTTRMYRDFELRLDFKVPPRGNSGVGLRGSSNGDPAFTGFEVQIFDSHGTEPSVSGCGAVYNAIAPREMAVRPPGEWNTYHIRLVGDTLNVWLNGQHILRDERLDDRGFFRAQDQPLPLRDRATTGYISLQDHGDAVAFRNIKIRDLSPDSEPDGFTPLFNGRDLTGWFARGGGAWKADGGTLVGLDGPGHLFTERKYDDFELRALVRVNERGNSGIYFRTVPRPENPDTWPLGYEAQVDNHDPRNFTGVIYDRAWPREGQRPITRDGAWFDYRVRAVGDRVQTWINGVPMVNATLTDFATGHIALQTHHPGNVIEFRDLRIRVLSDEQGED